MEIANMAHDLAIKARLKALNGDSIQMGGDSNEANKGVSVNADDERLGADRGQKGDDVNDFERGSGVNRPQAGPASQSDDKEKEADLKQLIGDTLLDTENVARRTNPLTLKDRVKANVRSINHKSK